MRRRSGRPSTPAPPIWERCIEEGLGVAVVRPSVSLSGIDWRMSGSPAAIRAVASMLERAEEEVGLLICSQVVQLSLEQ